MFKKILSYSPHIFALLFIMAFAAFAWTEPPYGGVCSDPPCPPGGNVPVPLNVGSTGQSKVGGLILGTNCVGACVNGLIIDKGNVGIGTTNPSEKLDVIGNIKIAGFKLLSGAGAGKVLTSDALGGGTWQPPFKAGVLVNYGNNTGSPLFTYNVSSCPVGWTESGLGSAITFVDPSVSPQMLYYGAWRTCFRLDKTCNSLVNYGNYVGSPSFTYNVSSCPAGWTEAGIGAMAVEQSSYSTFPPSDRMFYSAYRTCFICE